LSLQGVLVPLVTPLTQTGEVSKACVAALVESLRPHAAGLVPSLSTGEGGRLSTRQWTDMVAAAVEHAGDLPVVAGVLLADARAIGRRVAALSGQRLHALAVTPPFDPRATGADVCAHFAALRAATATPVVIYNESHHSGVTMNVETIRRVCEHGGVAGIKDSSGRIGVSRELAASSGVPVFQGCETLLAQSAHLAGSAVGLANLEPGLCAEAQRNPCPATRRAVASAVRRYGLERDDWYASIKRELVHRGVIRTSALAGEVRR
jgi:4-hydroxy-tetrahydrodipicolinate synthase